MNSNNSPGFLIQLPTVRFWLTLLIIVWFIGFVGVGWLIKSFLVLLGLVILTPIAIFVGARWWLSRNLVQDSCPTCSYEFAGLNRTQMVCPSCGETVKIADKQFQRLTPPGTIDVQAIEVTAQTIEE